MITKELERTLYAAQQDALSREHEYVTLEHLLYALTREQTAGQVIRACGGDLNAIRKELDQFFKDNAKSLKRHKKKDPQLTVAFDRVLGRAAMQSESATTLSMVEMCWQRSLMSGSPTPCSFCKNRV